MTQEEKAEQIIEVNRIRKLRTLLAENEFFLFGAEPLAQQTNWISCVRAKSGEVPFESHAI